MIIVRLARRERSSDLDALATQRYQWRSEEQGESASSFQSYRDHLEQWWRTHDATHVAALVCEGDDDIGHGWLALVERVPGVDLEPRRSAYLQSVYIEPCRRSQGAGSALVRFLLDRARDQNVDYVAVHPSPQSFSFYGRLGFSVTDGRLELDLRPANNV